MSDKTSVGLRLSWLRMQSGAVNKEMTQRSQFNSEQVELSEALVHEAGQNSLDAGNSGRGGPIRMRIAVVRPENEDADYIADLLTHCCPIYCAAAYPRRA